MEGRVSSAPAGLPAPPRKVALRVRVEEDRLGETGEDRQGRWRGEGEETKGQRDEVERQGRETHGLRRAPMYL